MFGLLAGGAETAVAQPPVSTVSYLTSYASGARVTIYRQNAAAIRINYSTNVTGSVSNLRVTLPGGAVATGFSVSAGTGGANFQMITVTAQTGAPAGSYELRYTHMGSQVVVPLRLAERATVTRIEPASGGGSLALLPPSTGPSEAMFVRTGLPVALNVNGTELDHAIFSTADFGGADGNIIASAAISNRSPTGFTLTITPAQGVSFAIDADDFLFAPTPNCRPLCEATGKGSIPILAGFDNRITSMSPLVVQQGGTVTLSGTNLSPPGHTVQFRGMSRSGQLVVRPVTGSNTSLTFSAPGDLRPDSVFIQFTPTSPFHYRVFDPAVPLPYPLYVREPPFVAALDTASRLSLLRTRLTGRGLASTADVFATNAPGVTRQSTTVTLAGQSVPVTRWQRFPGSSSEYLDVAPTFTQPVFGDLVVTTSGGSTTIQNAAFMPPPVVNGIDMQTANGDVPVPVGGILRPGIVYFLRGSNVFAVHDQFIRFGPTVRHGNTILTSGIQNIAGSYRCFFRLDANPAATVTGLLTVTNAGGTATVGPYTLAPQSQLPPIGGVSFTPNPALGGTALQATVAFNGPIAAGPDTNTVELVVPTALQGVIPPVVGIKVTGNPTTFSVRTLPTSVQVTGSLAVRHSPGNASPSQSVGVPVTLRPLELTGLTISQDTLTGGARVPTIRFTLNGSAPLSNPANVSLLSSNSALLALPATIRVTGTSFALTQQATNPVSTNTPVIVTASLNGVILSDTLVLTPPRVQSVTTSLSSLTTFQQGTVTITLDQTPTAPLAVALAASDTMALRVLQQPTMTSRTATVNIAARLVSQVSPVTLTATAGNTQSASVNVRPIAMRLLFSPLTVTAGQSTTATVEFPLLPTPPSDFGYEIRLSASDSSALVLTNGTFANPSSLRASAGQAAVVFPLVTRGPISSSRTVTITAELFQFNVVNPVPLARSTRTLTIVP